MSRQEKPEGASDSAFGRRMSLAWRELRTELSRSEQRPERVAEAIRDYVTARLDAAFANVFEDAARGKPLRTSTSLSPRASCRDCARCFGDGWWQPERDRVPCPDCAGTGLAATLLFDVATELQRGLLVLGLWEPDEAQSARGWVPGYVRRDPCGRATVYFGHHGTEPMWGVIAGSGVRWPVLHDSPGDTPGSQADADAWLLSRGVLLVEQAVKGASPWVRRKDSAHRRDGVSVQLTRGLPDYAEVRRAHPFTQPEVAALFREMVPEIEATPEDAAAAAFRPRAGPVDYCCFVLPYRDEVTDDFLSALDRALPPPGSHR